MSILKAIFYGIIQGLCEFLPISSSGHLALAQNIFGFDNIEHMITFDVILHLGTLFAVGVVYYKDVLYLIADFIGIVKKLFSGRIKEGLTDGEKFCVYIIIATIPLVAAALISDKIEALYTYSKLIGGLLILNGFVLILSDKISQAKANRTIAELGVGRAFKIGLFQLFAVLPGISRSGSTITGGLLNGLERKDAVKFSFIMSIPAILGANVLKITHIFENPIPSADIPAYIAGAITAAVAGFAAIKLLMYITKNHSFLGFSIYCFALGVLALIFG